MFQTTMEYNRAFVNALRGKADHHALQEGADSGVPGYKFPAGFKGDYAEAMAKENLFRRYGTMITAPEGDGIIQTVVSTAVAEITGEGIAFPENDDDFASIPCGAYKLASLAKLYKNFIMDKAFNVEDYLKNEFARRFGRAEEKVILNGSGNGEPVGVLQSAEVGKTTTYLTYDDVIALFFSVKPEYRKNAVWLMNDETALVLRTLKDKDGNYIWNAANSTIFDHPVVYSPYMPGIGAGAKPIVFGDLSYVWMVQRIPLTVRVLLERYVMQGMIGYAAHEFFDSKLIIPEAVKTLKIAE